MTGATLARQVLALAADSDRRARIATAARAFAKPDAARVIVDRALELARSARRDCSYAVSGVRALDRARHAGRR